MKYDNWIKTVPEEITEDTVWNLKVYRAALYLSERCWNDTQQIIDRRYFFSRLRITLASLLITRHLPTSTGFYSEPTADLDRLHEDLTSPGN